MRYEQIKDRKDTEFKRLIGVRRDTFEMMLETLKQALKDFGRPPKLKTP